MHQLIVSERPPFGITAAARRDGIRLEIVTKGNGEQQYVNLSREAAEALAGDLRLALDATASTEPDQGSAPITERDQGGAGLKDGGDA